MSFPPICTPGSAPAQPSVAPGLWRSASAFQVSLAVVGFMLAADNTTFWLRGLEIFGASPRLALFGAAVFALTLGLTTLLAAGPLRKPVLVALLLIAATASWFTDRLGITIDRDMIQNAMTTTVTEGRHLVTRGFLLHLLLFGLLPAALVWRMPVRRLPRWQALSRWVAAPVLCVALGAGLLAINFKDFSAVLRERKELVAAWQPAAPLGAAVRYARLVLRTREVTAAPLGLDAHKGARLAAAEKPVLTVLVVGETVRAQNWGLNGYARDTTPELRARGVVNFPQVESCGTATAVSMPCMFSVLPRRDYSQEKGLATENLLDVLSHAGVAVEWHDNNTGDKDIAARVTSARVPADPAACGEGECTDAVFLDLLKRKIAGIDRDTVLVLHQIGSHGPAYHLRYPRAFERFQPACHSAEFSDCTDEEIRNAYDNTVAFTDHVLAGMIDMLAAQQRVIPALVYVSDHGESLGENGLYLHGAPWFMAPDTQTRVPMAMWLSDAFRRTMQLDEACLRAAAEAPASHDNLFHTLLGLMDVDTRVRDAGLDRVSACHHPAA
ncbi:phosphoethanolamine transferase [Rhodobacter sp. CZR27]|uniref:phosphoethanolamine transferase n=1 Tax=Rhodobacter sp. CZR27 TaxID=2033869 RepID=UPI000BBF33F1|nr:phosphoethanolamine--lipid A transferase [Rhodobacter sp. CZR27]